MVSQISNDKVKQREELKRKKEKGSSSSESSAYSESDDEVEQTDIWKEGNKRIKDKFDRQ